MGVSNSSSVHPSESGAAEEVNDGQVENEGSRKHAADTFDPAAPPPFRIADVREAIPAHCWVKNPWRSMCYFVRDDAAIIGLLAAAVYINSWVFWPVYWIAQGIMFWALIVLGHDWRISHKIHHNYHGHADRDESWVPLLEHLYKKLDYSTKLWRFKIPLPLFAFPYYLLYRNPGKTGSHFNPYSELFKPNERKLVMTSIICCATMVAFLFYASTIVGPLMVLRLYGIPYLVFVMWLDVIVYLHHHGHDKLPWYRGKEWSYLRGALSAVDLDYGLFNKIQHDIGTHVIHHIFPQIPHYHLLEATREAKKVLGNYYRQPIKSGPIPFHIIRTLLKSFSRDHYLSDDGDIVYYQTDDKLFVSTKKY